MAENLFTADIGKATDGQQMLCAPSPSLDRRAGVVVECFPRMREIGVRSPVATDLINSLKQVVSAPLPNARQQVRVSPFLGDDHYKWLTRVAVGVARRRIAQWQ